MRMLALIRYLHLLELPGISRISCDPSTELSDVRNLIMGKTKKLESKTFDVIGKRCYCQQMGGERE